MKCPVDGETLVMTDRSGVEIDYCPRCRGVWLDRGELDKIIEQAAGDATSPEPAPRAAPQPAPEPRPYREPYREERPDPRYHHKGKRYKKRKSGFGDFLEDLFDFD